MQSKCLAFLLAGLMAMGWITAAQGTVEMSVQKTLKMESVPLDVAVSQNGRWVFVLTDAGEIHIYSAAGTLEDKLPVDKGTNGIKPGPREDILFLTSKDNKTVQIVILDFIQKIDVAGAPFKGPADAPVVIAVFSDFQ